MKKKFDFAAIEDFVTFQKEKLEATRKHAERIGGSEYDDWKFNYDMAVKAYNEMIEAKK